MTQEEKPECYKKPIQYDADACDRCKFSNDCCALLSKYLNQNEHGLWG